MFKRKGIMIDCSRNAVRTPETVMRIRGYDEKARLQHADALHGGHV